MGDVLGAYRVLVGIPEGKKPLGRPTRRRDDNTKTDLQEVGWGHGFYCSGSEQGQVAGSCGSGNESSVSIEYRECLDWLLHSQEGLCSVVLVR